MLKSQLVKLSGRIGNFIHLSVLLFSFTQELLSMRTELQPNTVGFWMKTDNNQGQRPCAFALEGTLLPGDYPGRAHGTCYLLLRVVKTFTPSRPPAFQLLRRPCDAGNNDNVHNVLHQERSFPLGGITCQKISVRTVPKVPSWD